MRPPTVPPARYLITFAWVLLGAQAICGQALEELEADFADRPILAIQIDGLKRVQEQLVRNQLRSAVGDPYNPQTVKDDVADRKSTRLNSSH